MTKEPTSTVKHCGYCSEGYEGRCDGVSVENIQALLGTIKSQKQTHDALLKKLSALEARNKELEADKAKLLADWRRMENALARISAFGDGEHSTIAHDAISSLSYTDSSKEELEKACLKGDDDACDKYVKLHPESIVKTQDITYTGSPSKK